jgi:hypothetical protein
LFLYSASRNHTKMPPRWVARRTAPFGALAFNNSKWVAFFYARAART